GFLQCLRPDPEEPRQLGALGRRSLRIEVIAEVDESRRLARRSGGGERGERERETAARPAPHDLDERAAWEGLAEEGRLRFGRGEGGTRGGAVGEGVAS